jgi:hypothetical protein
MRLPKAYLAIVTLVAATPAIAGEITGTGESTPVQSGRASSICAFSGLNDDGFGPSTLVQSYGAWVAALGRPNVPFPSPGQACRGN